MNNSIEVVKGNKIYVFITRDESEPFSSSEIADYFLNRSDFDEARKMQKETWEVPDIKHRKIMFVSDLKLGLKFCASKYGVSEEDIIRECRRIAPHVRIKQ
jgi:hypothetical protein